MRLSCVRLEFNCSGGEIMDRKDTVLTLDDGGGGGWGQDLGCCQPALQVVYSALEAAVVLGGLARHRLGQSRVHGEIQNACIYANFDVISVAPGSSLRLLQAFHEAVALLRQ